jgi:uncharacterized protein (TIGR03435 family)
VRQDEPVNPRGEFETVDRDDDRVNRVAALSGETEKACKFAAPESRRMVHNDSPPAETESGKPGTAFCNALGIVIGCPVADHTGLSGSFDIYLEFDPEGVNLGNGFSGLSSEVGKSDSTQPSIFSALQQQLGLKLQPHKEPTEVLVVDHLERLPTAN